MLAVIAVAVLALSAPQDEGPLNCDDALTTIELNECAARDLDAEDRRMRIYLARSIQEVRSGSDSDALGARAAREMGQAQKAWEAYVEKECDAVYTQWQGGTIRVLMALGCKRRLTQERTHHLWETFLTFPDSTEPVLPEPLPLRDETPSEKTDG